MAPDVKNCPRTQIDHENDFRTHNFEPGTNRLQDDKKGARIIAGAL